MKHEALLIYALVFSAVLPSSLHAQVATEKARQDRIAALDKAMDPARSDTSAILGKCPDPFYAVAPSGGDVGRSASTSSGAPGDKKVDLNSPKAVLARIVEKLHPTGLIDNGSKAFVVSADGSLFSIGKSYNVDLDNGSFEVRVVRADADTYTLEYSGETVTTPYDLSTDSAGSATISGK